jgi:hypothetical protein
MIRIILIEYRKVELLVTANGKRIRSYKKSIEDETCNSATIM